MSGWTTVLRGSPGTDGWTPPGAPYRGRSLSSQVALYWHVAAHAHAGTDTLGLAAVLVARGRLVLHGVLVLPDDTAAATVARLRRWAGRHPVETVEGPAPWRIVTRSVFFSPTATREHEPWAFVPNAYTGCGPVVGANLGGGLALVADYCAPRNGRNEGSWTVWLPGWGRNPDGTGWRPRSPNRPPLRMAARRVGWSVTFAPCERGHGKRTAAGPWRGAFVDVLAGAYALDADRGAGCVEHCRNFDVVADDLPLAVTADGTGAARMVAAVHQVHALALALDAKAGEWFTTAEDRRSWTHRLPLTRLQSPAAIADHLLRQLRVDPPLRRFPLTEDEHRSWWQAFHGGRCDDLPALRGRSFGAAVVDITSAYPLAFHLVDGWRVTTADRLERRTVTRELRALCRRAAKDPAVLLDPAVWARFGLTIADVTPDGEPFPVTVDDSHRPDGRSETVPVFATGRTMHYSWADVVAAATLSGRVPEIVNAVRLVPVGRQDELRQRVPVLPGLTIDADTGPVLGLVRRRREAKASRDTTTAALLHAAVNSLVSGQPSRLDDVRRKVGGAWETIERPGPWTFAPLAVTVTAGARLLLAILDRLVRDLGGVVAYRDTDSSIVPASPDGGTLTLADGSVVRSLAWADVARVLAGFEALSPDPGAWPVWKCSPKEGEAPLRCVVFGPKRHAEHRGTDDAPGLVEWTESGLGGMWADPASMVGRCAEGGRAWSKAAVEREVRYAVAKLADPTRAVRDPAAWDAGGGLPFPTLRRLAVTSPTLLATLPAALGARVGTPYVEAVVNDNLCQPTRSVVARDPGGRLDDWQALGWLDRTTGEPVKVTTDLTDYGTGAVILESLAARAGHFGAPPQGRPVGSVTVTPLSVRYAGRVSPVIDAADDGHAGSLARFRVAYADSCDLGPDQHEALVALARSMPAATFARLAGTTPRVAAQLARGELPRPATVRGVLAELRRSGGAWAAVMDRTCGLDECPVSVTGRRLYCCPLHAEAGRKRRQRAARP